KSTFADSVVLRNSTFKNISGAVIALDAENDERGIYNAENIVVENCSFEDIGWAALNIVRDGRDESTFGPMVVVKNSAFKNVGKDKRNKSGASVGLSGVQYINFSGCEFTDSAPVKFHLVVGDPVIKINDCKLVNTEKVITDDGSYAPGHFNNIWK
ncbi:MAG: alginate lyase, partial [Bacteroidetes bacterium]